MENDSRTYAEEMLKKYFKTFEYPFTAHQLNSFDQFVANDIPSIIKSSNPILLLEDKIGNTDEYAYRIEIFIGGIEGNQLYIGTPTVSLKDNKEIRVMYPNEARLRNLTYASNVEADILVKITFTRYNSSNKLESSTVLLDPKDDRYRYLAKVPLFRLPIMLHSRYCLLRNKPNLFLQEVGESPYDYGGYFVIDGSEKVLITRQEQAFNTLYVTKQKSDPKVEIFASIQCLNSTTKQVKRIAFGFLRNKNTIEVSLPFVRKPIPLFVLFRALGVQTDEDIIRLIFPNPDGIETKLMLPLLHESILDAHPFVDSYSAIQYIRTLTKGFSEAHVYNILYNQLFIHIDNKPMNKVTFLAECVRKILRVYADIDTNTDRDDIRNQRCLTSGLLTRMLFQNTYTNYVKAVSRAIDKEYKYNTTIYEGENFLNIFLPGNMNALFLFGFITDGINKGFKGKWSSGVGEEKSGALQPLSRLSYLDFLSHCRRVVLEIDDTAISLPGPHRLHTTQFGYFCTSETPGGKSIGITKNLSMLTAISLSTDINIFKNWLFDKMGLLYVNDLTSLMTKVAVPVYINNGIVGFTLKPEELVQICKLMKYTGCLPAYSSISFNIRERRISLFFDEGRPLRPLIHIEKGAYPYEKIKSAKTWRELVIGNFEKNSDIDIVSTIFRDPLVNVEKPSAQDYINLLKPYVGVIEYVDPYESNEAFVAMYPELIKKETTHVELHPSSIVGLLTSMIPFPNHNQSPRNQLSCSQSKQGISMSSTNYKNRFDNQNHVLCYGEAPLVRTLYYDYVADGQIGYGHNLVLAMGCFTGYNQEDGIVMNLDSFQRGMFRNMTFKSYEAFEEDDDKANTKVRIANPSNVPGWTRLKPGVDYRKLDERGIVKKGEYVDENTVIVGRYIQSQNGEMNDASITAQVWTSGIVEEISVTVNNKGLSLVKIRVIQDRIPELGDKFSNRHGQKGTIGMLVKGCDMPRTASGMTPDMMMNPHAIPSRMTIAQLLESMLGKAACLGGFIGDATAFMNEGGIEKNIGDVLENQFGFQRYGEELFYDGTTGTMIPSTIFVGNVYTMRLKHMVEDKWNARGSGRREQKTHQPTGGRGNQGGLRIGEMERDALLGHGISSFVRESYMKRSDGTTMILCNGCGTVPVYNLKDNFYVCPLCDGPVQFVGDSASNFEILPTMKRSITTLSEVEIPYSLEVLNKELNTYMNMFMRFLTSKDITSLKKTPFRGLKYDEVKELLNMELKPKVIQDKYEPNEKEEEPEITVSDEQLEALGANIEEDNEEEQLSLPKINIEEAKKEVDKEIAAESSALDLQDADDIEFVQSVAASSPSMIVQQPVMMTAQPMMMTAQPMMMTQQPYVLVPTNPTQVPLQVVNSQVPNAPQTLVVDTSPQAMEADGIDVSEREVRPLRSILKRPNSPSRFNRSSSPTQTQRNSISGKPTFSINKLDSGESQPMPSSSNLKVNILKEE